MMLLRVENLPWWGFSIPGEILWDELFGAERENYVFYGILAMGAVHKKWVGEFILKKQTTFTSQA